jgi:hypothetical protein
MITGCEDYPCPHPWPREVEQELDDYMPSWRDQLAEAK